MKIGIYVQVITNIKIWLVRHHQGEILSSLDKTLLWLFHAISMYLFFILAM